MTKEILIVTTGAVVVAVIIAVVRYQMRHKENDSDIERIYVDEVRLGEIKNWFANKLSDSRKGIILYPTKENIEKWQDKKFSIKIKDSKNMLIQIVYDETKEEVINYREISFSNLGSKIEKLMKENNGMIVVEL